MLNGCAFDISLPLPVDLHFSKDSNLSKLELIKWYKVRLLDFNGCDLSIGLFKNILSIKDDLKTLKLINCTGVDDSFVERICQSFPDLETLDLSGCTQVSDASYQVLSKMPALKKLCLEGTSFTPAASNQLMRVFSL